MSTLSRALTRNRPRILLVALLAALGVTVSACGNKEDVTTKAETEGIYLDVGPLTYQVQLSRQLNPADAEDREYLVGVPPAQAALSPDQVWFAIWVRVKNETDGTHRATGDFRIIDTLENVYEPIDLAPANAFAYEPEALAPNAVLPSSQSPAATGPIQGSLLLFKLKRASLDNRPLELEVEDPAGPARRGTVNLDV